MYVCVFICNTYYLYVSVALNYLLPFCTQYLNLLLIHFYDFPIWIWSWILYSFAMIFAGGTISFLPRSTWILWTLLYVLPRDFVWFYFWDPHLWLSLEVFLWASFSASSEALSTAFSPRLAGVGLWEPSSLPLSLGKVWKVIYTPEVPL